jgi:hypothetical protein
MRTILKERFLYIAIVLIRVKIVWRDIGINSVLFIHEGIDILSRVLVFLRDNCIMIFV